MKICLPCLQKVKECKALFTVKYAPGKFVAVAYDAAGQETGRSCLYSARTAGIALHPEKTTVKPGEIVYIPVTLEDKKGIVESNADRKLTVTVEGGALLAFGSANPCTTEEYHTGQFTTYYGRALAIVRAGDSGIMTVKATDGNSSAAADIQFR